MKSVGTDAWGVYVKPCDNLMPSGNTITGSGQVTIVIPENAVLSDIEYHAGFWDQNAMVKSPEESPGKIYVSVGFLNDYPQIVYDPEKETLLFTCKITGDHSFEPHLIDNEQDPFAQMPNSVSSNPGNEISVIDFDAEPTGYYSYSGNYDDETTHCNDIPGDTSGNNVTTTTTEELLSGPLFTVSPNPTHDWLKIRFIRDLKRITGTLRLSTLNGIVLGTMEKEDGRDMSLQVANLPNGLYVLLFESENGEYHQRERFLKH